MSKSNSDRRVTIYEVAERSGVSISTVSNVLNKPDRVNADTRARVLAVVDDLGFIPKAEAVSLAKAQVGRIGVMAPFSAYSTYLRRLAGMVQAAGGSDLDLAVFDLESAAVASSPVLASMPARGRLDGLIVMGLEIEATIARRLHHRGLPTVVVDAESEMFSRVLIDDVAGGSLAAEYLLDRGYRRFGYLLERQVAEYESQAIQRHTGFAAVVEKRPATTLRRISSDNSVEAARAAVAQLLDASDRPEVIMAHHDMLAVGALRAAHDRGLRVPQDVAIMGFDDGEAAEAADLTTVRQPFEESGSVALKVLLGHINGTELRSTTMLDVRIVQRATA